MTEQPGERSETEPSEFESFPTKTDRKRTRPETKTSEFGIIVAEEARKRVRANVEKVVLIKIVADEVIHFNIWMEDLLKTTLDCKACYIAQFPRDFERFYQKLSDGFMSQLKEYGYDVSSNVKGEFIISWED